MLKIRYFLLAATGLGLSCLSVAAQTADGSITTIAQSPSVQTSDVILSNVNLVIAVAEGRATWDQVGATAVSDLSAALTIAQSLRLDQISQLQNKINTLNSQISNIRTAFDGVSNSQLDDALLSALNSVDDLEAAKTQLQATVTQSTNLSRSLRVLGTVGKGLSVLDTGLQGYDAYQAFAEDASTYDKGVASADLLVSTAVTSFVLTGSKFVPLVGTVKAGTDLTTWYVDALGTPTNDAAAERATIITQAITDANLIIQNRITAAHRSPNGPPSDEDVVTIAREEYNQVRRLVESFEADLSWVEWVYGVRGSSQSSIDNGIALIDTLLEGTAQRRAIQFSNDILKSDIAIEELNQTLTEINLLLEDIGKTIPDHSGVPIAINLANFDPRSPLTEEGNLDETTDEDTSDNELVVTENDEGVLVLGNNAGTNIEIQPTGPTPEEIAEAERLAEIAQAERLAELRRQEIARLEIERTAQFEVKLAREVQIQNLDNELALLEFGDQQEVQNALSLVTGEEQRLRAELNDTGLNATDQQLLQDLLVYQETLEDELDRITGRISSLESERDTLQANLDGADTIIIANSNQLNALDYDYNQFTEPTTSEELIDFSDYDYELPTFDPTELLTSDLSNVVGHAVSVPVVGGNNRVDIDLVAEDNTILDLGIPGAITEIEDESSDLLDGFTHLYFGSGVDENGDDSQWIYGEAATPEQFALRTGTATFNGGLSGYYAHGSVSDHTLYQDGLSGSLALEVDFGTNRLTGEGEIEIDTAVRSETLAFSLDESTISETDSGLTRSLGFSANATPENESGVSGNLGGTFYGEDASEAAGSFAFDLGTGFSLGLWAAGESFEIEPEPINSEWDGSLTYIYARDDGPSSSSPSQGTISINGANADQTQVTFRQGSTTVDPGVIDVQVKSVEFENIRIGSWGSELPLDIVRDEETRESSFGHFYILQESEVIPNLGTATYNGYLLGDYYEPDTRLAFPEAVTGGVTLEANFGDSTITGMLDVHVNNVAWAEVGLSANIDRSGSNPEFEGSLTGENIANSDFNGKFGGSDGAEIAGNFRINSERGFRNNGTVSGVFATSIEFTGIIPTGPNNPSLTVGIAPSPLVNYTNYSDWIGVASYSFNVNNANGTHSHTGLEFASIEGVDIDDYIIIEETTPSDGNTRLGGGALGDRDYTDTNNNTYDYLAWGFWGSTSQEGGTVVTNGDIVSSGSWLIMDQTTNLPTSGSASYSGDLEGQLVNSADGFIGGSIQIEADFASDRVTGDISIDTRDIFTNQINEGWASATFDTTIRRDTDGSGFQGALTGSDVNSGVIFGGFAGPNAEEVGGGWQIDHVDGSNASGIFRAQN